MSGRTQHYIPQSLLRGFGKQGKGKAVQVTVYSSEVPVFTAATDGVAAQRYFYSKLPGDAGVETLDDRITAFETRLAMSLVEFRDVVPGHPVDATKAAEAVTHLCVRQAHLRYSFASAAELLWSATAKLFLDKEWTRKALEVDGLTPGEPFRNAIHKIYDRSEDQLNQMGITRTKFERWMFDKLKTDYDRIFPKLSSLLQSFSAQVQGQTNRFAREAHNKALERTLAPPARVEILEQFVWRTEPGPVSGLVLPDCVAMSWTARIGYQPLMSAGKDIGAVIMPLCHDRLLVGHCAGTTGDVPEMINELAAVCSWDFFIARDRRPEFERLIPRIGERARKLVDEAVRAAFEQRN